MSKRAKMSDSSKQRSNPRSNPRKTRDETASRSAGATDPVSDYEALMALQASDKLYYRIGEVSKLTGVKAHVLRYWETEFRWMTPPKSRSKQRLYRRRDIEFVWLLKRLLWEERYTIAGARQRIQELGVEEALALLQNPPEMEAQTPPQFAPEWGSIRAALDEMRSELVSIRGVLQETA